MSDHAILQDIAGKLPVRPNARKRQIWMACFAVGIASFAWLLLKEPQRAWGSFTINTLYWLGISMGGVVLSAAIRLTNGKWAGPIQRVGESLSAYLPFGIGTMVVLLAFGTHSLLPWTHGDLAPRLKPYLNLPFLWIRTLGGLLLFWWLASKLVKQALRADAKLLLPHVSPDLKPAYEKLAAGWKGDAQEEAVARHEFAHLSPQIVLAFVVFVSVQSWDFILSITPNWVSGLFGWFVYASTFNTAVCMTALLTAQVRQKYRLEPYVQTAHFWDTGKIIFSFCVFWVYTFWSQYLPIWYANMPEETWWVFLRMEEPWRAYGFLAFGMIFLIPFFGLMNKTTKSSPFWLSAFSILVMAGVWLERHVLVMPSLNPDTVWIGLPEVGVTIGFLGLFGWAVQSFLTKYPCVNVKDALAAAGGHGHGH